MKTVLVTMAVLILAAPATAVERQSACLTDAATSAAVLEIETKLPPSLAGDGEPIPEWFYAQLACSLFADGFDSQRIAEMPADDLIDHAVDYFTRDRSRADALLAILQAMKQAKLTPPAPEAPARP